MGALSYQDAYAQRDLVLDLPENFTDIGDNDPSEDEVCEALDVLLSVAYSNKAVSSEAREQAADVINRFMEMI